MRVLPGWSLVRRQRLSILALAAFLAAGVIASRERVYAGPPVCGNGIIEPPEACDDGNGVGGDGCSASCQIEQQCYDPGNAFSFFVWSDSYTSSGEYGVMRVLADAVDRSRYPNRIIPRFWLSTGDIPFMSDGGDTKLDSLNAIISNQPGGPQQYPFACSASSGQFPYFVAVGNHDIDGYNSMTPATQYAYWRNVVGAKVTSTLVGLANFQQGPNLGYDSRTTYSFDYKNAHFVVTNQYFDDPAYPTANPTACIRPGLYDWIDQDLSHTTKPLKFVFGHESAWPRCSSEDGYGGSQFCPASNPDNMTPAYRPRPYSALGPWPEPFGRHWGDSLEDPNCPAGSREAFWSMLASHHASAHVVGHDHTYSSRLVQGNGLRRNDVSAYSKTGQSFAETSGVWEINAGAVHSSDGASYLLATVRDATVTFEAYDSMNDTEPFNLIESWTVRINAPPTVTITSPTQNGTVNAPGTVTVTANAADSDGTIASVAFYLGATLLGVDTTAPYSATWSPTISGPYSITAVATDNDGSTTTSPPVNVMATGLKAVFINPVDGATNVDVRQTFSWTTIANAQAYYLYGGSTPGAKDLLNTGEMQQTTYRVPETLAGRTVYLRLWTKVAGVWRFVDATITTRDLVAHFIYPPGSTADVSINVEWTAVDSAQAYYLYGGSTLGAKDIVNTGEIPRTWYRLPPTAAGRTLYLRLWTKLDGVWRYVDRTVTIAPLMAQFINPSGSPASVSQDVTWTPVVGIQAYYLYVGSTAGAKDLVDTGETQATSRRLPATLAGRTVYLRLWTKANGVWAYVDRTVTLTP